MANNIDFILKSGLQVPGNVSIGSYATVNAAPTGGLITSGNVGIGTSVASNVLTVGGNIQIAAGGTAGAKGIYFPDGTFQSTASTGTAPGGTYNAVTSTGSIEYNGGGGNFAGSTQFVFDSSNIRVGIGTSTVTNTLSVYGSTPALFNTVTGGVQQIAVGTGSSSAAIVGYTGTIGQLQLNSNGTAVLTWNGTSVGTGGVTTPKNSLDVGGTLGMAVGNSYAGTATAPTNGIIVQGSVGIGTTNPGAKLEVDAATSGVGMLIKTAATTPGDAVQIQNSTGSSLFVISSSGAVTTGSWTASAVGSGYGGTGLSTFAQNSLLYASAANTWSTLASSNTSALVTSSSGTPSWTSGSTANRVLRTDGTTVSFSQVALGTDVSGQLPLANGGTNASLTATQYGIVYGTSTGMAFSSTSAFTFNSSTGYVGINNSNPSSYLDVNGLVTMRNGANVISGGLQVLSGVTNLSGALQAGTITSNGTISSAGAVTVASLTSNAAITVNSGGIQVTGNSSLTGNLSITGNIIFQGNSYITQSNVLVVNDPIIYLANDNPGNTYDIGVVGNYVSSSYYHTGLVRNHSDSSWTIFDTLTTEPTNTVNWSDSTITYGKFKAGNVTIAGNTASTSSGTGALVISGTGGVGIGGALNVGGAIQGSSTINAGGTAVVNYLISNTGVYSGGASNFTSSLVASSITSNTTINGATIVSSGAVSAAAISSSGTLSAANIVGNTSITSGGTISAAGAVTVASLTSNAAITGATMVSTGAVSAAAISSSGSLSAGNIVANTSITSSGTISATGAVTAASLASNAGITGTTVVASGAVSAAAISSSGTLSAANIVGNTSITSGGTFSAAGAVTAASLASNAGITGTTVVASGAVSAAAISSSGSITGASLASNAGITGTTVVASGAVSAAAISTSGNLYANNIVGNTSITSGGTISAAGAVTAASLVSNSSVTGSTYIQNGVSTTTSTTSPLTIDSFSTSSYRTASYLVQVTDNTNSQYHSAQMLLIHDGTTVYKTEWNIVYSVAQLGTFDAAIAGSTLSLTFTASSATNKTIKLIRTGINL